jgi:hypothetical protein
VNRNVDDDFSDCNSFLVQQCFVPPDASHTDVFVQRICKTHPPRNHPGLDASDCSGTCFGILSRYFIFSRPIA